MTTTFADVMLGAVFAELQRGEPEVIASRRRKIEQNLRDACKAEGLSDQFRDDALIELRAMWHRNDTSSAVLNLLFGGEYKA